MSVPKRPKIYHIAHVDRLLSIIVYGGIWCDDAVQQRKLPGTDIGLKNIKSRRRKLYLLGSHPNLRVSSCVPFYFAPRSVMLYTIHKGGADQNYKDGQDPIVHIEADLYATIEWAKKYSRRWAFSSSNAGAYDFKDKRDPADLDIINWEAVRRNSQWGADAEIKKGKQAEFLLEDKFPWYLVERVGVNSVETRDKVLAVYAEVANAVRERQPLRGHRHKPPVGVMRGWYYRSV